MSTHTQWGRERGPAPPQEASSLSTNDDSHPILVSVLMNVVPWVAIGVTGVFFLVYVLSRLDGDADTAALTVFIMMTVLTGFAWATRMALRGLVERLDTRDTRP